MEKLLEDIGQGKVLGMVALQVVIIEASFFLTNATMDAENQLRDGKFTAHKKINGNFDFILMIFPNFFHQLIYF